MKKTIALNLKILLCMLFLVCFIHISFTPLKSVAFADGPHEISSTSLQENYEAKEASAMLYAPSTYKVVAGDSMWKIAVKFEIGLSELIAANPHIKDPTLIFVGQSIYIPESAPLKTLEDEVLRLVNVERVKNGLQTLKLFRHYLDTKV